MDKIVLKGMEFYGRHGVLPRERELGQRFIVDVEIFLDLTEAGRSDDLSRTIDYAKVFRLVEEIVTGPPRQLLEAVAEDIAAAVLERFPAAEAVVRVKKPAAPLPGRFEYAAVEIKRARERINR
ncbi:MAG: dihydroneopterin aldolase [Armatimonadetes bacterium]|nr:dihydroneopterin aldolase [Armatimonadota bacterium]